MTSASNTPAVPPRHPFLELCLESDLLDIDVAPSGPRGAFLVGVSAKTLASTSQVYALALRYGLRAADADPSENNQLWVTVDGAASKVGDDGIDFGTTLDNLPEEDKADVTEAINRLSEIHASASKIVAQFMTIAQGHVYSVLNGLAAQAGRVFPEGSVPQSWQDALEVFVRLCRTGGLGGLRLSAAAEGLSLVDASARVVDEITGASHDLVVTWIAWDSGLPVRVASVDGVAVSLEGGEIDLGGLFKGSPQASREQLSDAMLRLVLLSDLAGEVVLAHQAGAVADVGTPEEMAAFMLDAQRCGNVVGGVLGTLDGVARLHTGG